MSCARYDLEIKQGSTYSKSVSQLAGGKIQKLIEDLTPGAPTLITITGHGIPATAEIPVYVSHVKGATRANTKPGKPVVATYVDVDTLFLDIDTVAQTYEGPSGLLTYYAPTDLTNYTARMHIRENIDDTATILELATGGNGIEITPALGKVTFTLTAAQTAAFDFDVAYYDLEIVDNSAEPVVTRILEGEVEICREVTR